MWEMPLRPRGRWFLGRRDASGSHASTGRERVHGGGRRCGAHGNSPAVKSPPSSRESKFATEETRGKRSCGWRPAPSEHASTIRNGSSLDR